MTDSPQDKSWPVTPTAQSGGNFLPRVLSVYVQVSEQGGVFLSHVDRSLDPKELEVVCAEVASCLSNLDGRISRLVKSGNRVTFGVSGLGPVGSKEVADYFCDLIAEYDVGRDSKALSVDVTRRSSDISGKSPMDHGFDGIHYPRLPHYVDPSLAKQECSYLRGSLPSIPDNEESRERLTAFCEVWSEVEGDRQTKEYVLRTTPDLHEGHPMWPHVGERARHAIKCYAYQYWIESGEEPYPGSVQRAISRAIALMDRDLNLR